MEQKVLSSTVYDLSPSLEDYLEEIYRFSRSQSQVRVSDLSNQLKVSLPSVSKALQKLKKKGYIEYHKYGDIYLSELGNDIGLFLVERNAILQEFLYMIEADCNIAEEAEAMEHYLSRTTIYSIQAIGLFMKQHQDVYKELRDFINKMK